MFHLNDGQDKSCLVSSVLLTMIIHEPVPKLQIGGGSNSFSLRATAVLGWPSKGQLGLTSMFHV